MVYRSPYGFQELENNLRITWPLQSPEVPDVDGQVVNNQKGLREETDGARGNSWRCQHCAGSKEGKHLGERTSALK